MKKVPDLSNRRLSFESIVLRTAVVCMGRRFFGKVPIRTHERAKILRPWGFWALDWCFLFVRGLNSFWVLQIFMGSSDQKVFLFEHLACRAATFVYMFHIFLSRFFFPRIPLLKQHWIRDVFVELLLSFCARQVFLLNGRTSKQFNQRQLSNRKIVFPLSATRFGLPWLVRAKEQSIGWNSKVWSTCLWDMNLNTNQANTIQKPSYTTNTICKKVQSHFLLYGKKA